MNHALVQDVVAEVMRRLENRDGSVGRVRAVEAPAPAKPTSGGFGIFSTVDDAVAAASESQKKLINLSLEDRDAIVKLVKKMVKDNAQAWGKMELDETRIGRLDHKV